MRPHLVGYRDPVGDQIPVGGHGVAQRGGGCGVDDQGPQPSVVGAHDVGQDVGVEPVVFVSDRAVAAPQILDLVGRDHVTTSPAARIASTTDRRGVRCLLGRPRPRGPW